MNKLSTISDPGQTEFLFHSLQRFMPMTTDEMYELLKYCEFREFGKKEIVVDQGEVDLYLNMVIKGLVRKYIRVGKNDVTLQLATEGHVTHSEISFLTQMPSQVVLETLEPTVMGSISFEKMQDALENYSKGEELGRLILTNMFIRRDERQYNLLAKSTRQRFLDYVNHHPHMLQRVPQKYLASYLNIKPETFSRLKHLVRFQ